MVHDQWARARHVIIQGVGFGDIHLVVEHSEQYSKHASNHHMLLMQSQHITRSHPIGPEVIMQMALGFR